MAKKDIPEMVKITLDTSNMQDFNDLKEPLGTFRGALKTLDSDLSAFERVIKSASNYFEFFNNNLKKINEKTGLAEQSFFVRKDEVDNVLFALKAKISELATVRGDLGFNLTSSDVEILQSTRKVLGKEAQKMAIEEVNRLGGKASVNPKNKDKLDIELPVSKSVVQEMTSREKSALITQAIPYGRKLSRIESRKRKKAELERLSEEEMERTMQEVEAVKSQKLAEDKAKQDAEKLLEKAKKDEEREKKEKKARAKSNARKVLRVFKTVGATLVIIADIVRRILTATLKSASENEKKAMEAHSVGVTAMQRRNLDLFDIAHGMEKGTSFGAIQSVQSLFGNITSLDEKALSTLARVMGSEISDLVTSGMGGKNPDQLLDKILDKYFSQYLSGKNSLGQSVGQEEARRELITSLQSVSPEIAKVFARMVDDYASGYYKPFSNSKGWRDTVLLNRTGLNEADLDFNAELGKQFNEIIAIVDDLKNGFFIRLGASMNGLIKKIKNLRINYSSEANIEQDKRNKKASLRTAEAINQQFSLFNSRAQDRIDTLSSLDVVPLSSNVKKEQAERFHYTAEILAGIKSGIYDKNYFKNNLTGTGMTSNKDIDAYIERGKKVAENALFDKDVQDEIARAIVNLERLKEIKDNVKHDVGSGKLKDLSLTEAEQTVLAQKVLSANYEKMLRSDKTFAQLGANEQATIITAYFEYLKDNPSVYRAEEAYMNDEVKAKARANLKRITAERGAKMKDSTQEERMRAFAEANADYWYAIQVKLHADSASKNYLEKVAVEEAKERLNKADSKTATILSLKNPSVTPMATYKAYGAQGQSGEYLIKLQMIDSNGREVGSPIGITTADTQGQSGYLGKFTADARGNLSYTTAE